jgi:L-fucose isomerase-like protein
MKDLKVALVPIARIHFDTELAEQVVRSFRTNLIFNGLKVLGSGALITSQEQVRQLTSELAGQDFDLLLVFQATFADSSLLVAIAEAFQKPIFLWAAPEEPTGGRLRLASLSGLTLAAHALKLHHIPYDFIYAPINAQDGFQKCSAVAAASRVIARLRTTRLGVVGEAPQGMETCRLDEPGLQQKFGLAIVRIELEQVLERVRELDIAQTAPVRSMLARRLANLDDLDQGSLNRSLSTYLVLKEIAAEEKLDGLAVRCWPEFFEELECAACGALSMLSNERLASSCEADVNGAITQLILQWLSGAPAFSTDLVTADIQADEIVLWHCGQAPLAMADPQVQPRAAVHSNRGLPLLMDFPLKPGKVTFARLSQTHTGLQLVVAAGEMLSAQPSFTGTSGVVRMRHPAQDVLNTLLSEGLEHHLSVVYGEHLPALYKLAQMLDLPVIEL